jgi:hypothetical protein
MKWKWSISSKYEVLSLEKVVQIRGVIPHYLTHMVQSVALKKGIHEEIVRILGDLAHRCPFVEGSEALLRYRNFDSCSTSLEMVQKYWICYLVTGIFKQFHGTDIGCVR